MTDLTCLWLDHVSNVQVCVDIIGTHTLDSSTKANLIRGFFLAAVFESDSDGQSIFTISGAVTFVLNWCRVDGPCMFCIRAGCMPTVLIHAAADGPECHTFHKHLNAFTFGRDCTSSLHKPHIVV